MTATEKPARPAVLTESRLARALGITFAVLRETGRGVLCSALRTDRPIGGIVATGKAPISGNIAILFGVLAATLLVIAIFDGVSWSTVVGAFLHFTIFVMMWRGAKKQNQEYQEGMERPEERLRGN
jgi:hypothetical protein